MGRGSFSDCNLLFCVLKNASFRLTKNVNTSLSQGSSPSRNFLLESKIKNDDCVKSFSAHFLIQCYHSSEMVTTYNNSLESNFKKCVSLIYCINLVFCNKKKYAAQNKRRSFAIWSMNSDQSTKLSPNILLLLDSNTYWILLSQSKLWIIITAFLWHHKSS